MRKYRGNWILWIALFLALWYQMALGQFNPDVAAYEIKFWKVATPVVVPDSLAFSPGDTLHIRFEHGAPEPFQPFYNHLADSLVLQVPNSPALWSLGRASIDTTVTLSEGIWEVRARSIMITGAYSQYNGIPALIRVLKPVAVINLKVQ